MRYLEIFKQLNKIPRPSHHEERVADFLCEWAERFGLDYDRDAYNCVVIRKPATPGHENATPVVILNHMDMVCVAEVGRKFDPLNDPIEPYVDGEWLKARGTSLGADNGMGLSMALAILEDDSIVHGPLEVITTTNEEDGMTGAANLSPDFLRGRKVINLDSEDYDTITTGAAGAYLQIHHLPLRHVSPPGGKLSWLRITIEGGRGGHSGVDINKGRASATTLMWAFLSAIGDDVVVNLADLEVGNASASIASAASAVICVNEDDVQYVKAREAHFNEWLSDEYGKTDPGMRCTISPAEPQRYIVDSDDVDSRVSALENIPQGVVKMSETMPGTVETSNNVGRITTEKREFVISTHTRSFVESDMIKLGEDIKAVFADEGATTELVMSAPAWQENQDSDFLRLTSDTFNDVLGWRPRMVAMHFVLEAGFFVQKYPGIEMASIGPRILEPHSTSERVNLKTCDDIWRVTVELLKRLASE
ncbi:MAG: beta-Ala-His dipeptidase [Muribaculaceae bacterium]|nr:beta-Ala-His dipeptidase [Muribaculaceae bacterium]